jgi:predicted RNase H-like nuclease (RuvC/YqgF family)
VIEALAPNHWQQIVTFADGEKLLINNADLDASSVPFPRERTYPAEYTEAIAAIEERHKQELERLSQELRIGLQAEAGAKAEAQVQEQIQSLQNLYKQQKEQNIQLQQRLDEMEGLRKLEIENQQL